MGTRALQIVTNVNKHRMFQSISTTGLDYCDLWPSVWPYFILDSVNITLMHNIFNLLQHMSFYRQMPEMFVPSRVQYLQQTTLPTLITCWLLVPHLFLKEILNMGLRGKREVIRKRTSMSLEIFVQNQTKAESLFCLFIGSHVLYLC